MLAGPLCSPILATWATTSEAASCGLASFYDPCSSPACAAWLRTSTPVCARPHVRRQHQSALRHCANVCLINNRCSHTTQLALEENGGLPRLARLEPCAHRHLTLLFLLEPDGEVLSQTVHPTCPQYHADIARLRAEPAPHLPDLHDTDVFLACQQVLPGTSL